MKVAFYGRYSTDLQDTTSIGGQFDNCEALAQREGLTIYRKFSDEGISGNDDGRPDYKRLLAALENKEVDGVICDETNRLTRNQAELHRIVAELQFREQFLITCDGIDTRQESAEIILAVKAAMDQMEGRKIGHRTYRSLRERHKRGYSAGGRIYGYTSEEADGDYKRRIVDPAQAPIVAEIFERYAEGESAKAIVRDLNERGIPSPGSFWKLNERRAQGWPHTTLLGSETKASGILRNEIYTGRVQWNKRKGKKVPGTARRIQERRPKEQWITYQDDSLRIVSDDLFTRVQNRLRGARKRAHPKNKRPRGRPTRYLLSGLMKCASCGGNYVVCNRRSYCCSSHTNGRDAICDQKRHLKRSIVEPRLLAGVKDQLLAPEVMDEVGKLVSAKLREMRQANSETRIEAKELRADRKDVDRKIENVTNAIAEVGVSDSLKNQLTKLERQRERLAKRITAAPSLTVLPDILPNAADRWRRLATELESLDSANPAFPKARSALQELLGAVEITETDDGVDALVGLKPAVYKCELNGAQERT